MAQRFKGTEVHLHDHGHRQRHDHQHPYYDDDISSTRISTSSASVVAGNSNKIVDMLRRELAVLKAQLCEERAAREDLEDELEALEAALSRCRCRAGRRRGGDGSEQRGADDDDEHSDRHSWQDDSEGDRRSDLMSRYVPPSQEPPIGSDAFRASGSFGFRYVPPLDFLPAAFVHQYADVLCIVDRYAQLFHRFHVGGGSKDPALAVRTDEAQQSAVGLLEAHVSKLQHRCDEQAATIAALTEQLSAARTAAVGPKFSDPHDRKGHNREGDWPDDQTAQGPASPTSDGYEDPNPPRASRRRGDAGSPRGTKPRQPSRRFGGGGAGDPRPQAGGRQPTNPPVVDSPPPQRRPSTSSQAPTATTSPSPQRGDGRHSSPSNPRNHAAPVNAAAAKPRPVAMPDLTSLYALPRSPFAVGTPAGDKPTLSYLPGSISNVYKPAGPHHHRPVFDWAELMQAQPSRKE